jgi:hypothetical protein
MIPRGGGNIAACTVVHYRTVCPKMTQLLLALLLRTPLFITFTFLVIPLALALSSSRWCAALFRFDCKESI